MPIWKAWRIQRDLNTLDRQSILLDSAAKVIHLKNETLKSAVLQSQALDSAYLAKESEVKACRAVIGLSNDLHKAEIKQAKRKGIKTGFLGGSAIGLLLILLL